MGPSEFEKIQTDPAYKQSQFAADQALKDMGEKGGYTEADKAALQAIQNKTAQAEGAGRSAIEANMASRGQLGSGAQLAMQLQNQSQAADRDSAAAQQAAGSAQARAYQAILDRSKLASSNQAQDWNQQAQRAGAMDQAARFNAGQRADVNRYNANIPQQNFSNQMSLADKRAQMDLNAAQYHQQEGSRVQATWNQAISGQGQAAGGIYNMASSGSGRAPASSGSSGGSNESPYQGGGGEGSSQVGIGDAGNRSASFGNTSGDSGSSGGSSGGDSGSSFGSGSSSAFANKGLGVGNLTSQQPVSSSMDYEETPDEKATRLANRQAKAQGGQ
jgi:hypothetical protein